VRREDVEFVAFWVGEARPRHVVALADVGGRRTEILEACEQVRLMGRSISACASPVVVRVVARLEAVGFDHGCCLGETMRDSSRLVGVAPEGDGHSAFLVPPARDLGVEGAVGVDSSTRPLPASTCNA
jgi:hypothetical protein